MALPASYTSLLSRSSYFHGIFYIYFLVRDLTAMRDVAPTCVSAPMRTIPRAYLRQISMKQLSVTVVNVFPKEVKEATFAPFPFRPHGLTGIEMVTEVLNEDAREDIV